MKKRKNLTNEDLIAILNTINAEKEKEKQVLAKEYLESLEAAIDILSIVDTAMDTKENYDNYGIDFKLLETLYEMVSDYAYHLGISLTENNESRYYTFTYNNSFYEIGYYINHNTITYCKRIHDVSDDVIDFNDIINWKNSK